MRKTVSSLCLSRSLKMVKFILKQLLFYLLLCTRKSLSKISISFFAIRTHSNIATHYPGEQNRNEDRYGEEAAWRLLCTITRGGATSNMNSDRLDEAADSNIHTTKDKARSITITIVLDIRYRSRSNSDSNTTRLLEVGCSRKKKNFLSFTNLAKIFHT